MKILYIMNVEWNWIKQRPHFIAENLAEKHNLVVLYPYSYHRKGLGFVKNKVAGVKPHKYFNLPLRGRFHFIRSINNIYLKILFKVFICLNKPDLLWIGRPENIDILPNTDIPIVYDCMDDYYSMNRNDTLLEQERKTVERADVIFASANSLINKLSARYHISEKKVTLVRNGYDGNILPLRNELKINNEFTLCYVGTVSKWFDFELIDKLIKKFPSIKIVVVGPIEVHVKEKVESYKKVDAISFVGSVEHSELYETVKGYDCLIMPFILNGIIESVDPVKLYEYINFGKNIISIKYDEILRFESFVHFYSSHEEAISIVHELIENNELKYSDACRREFLKNNTWASRIELINSTLENENI